MAVESWIKVDVAVYYGHDRKHVVEEEVHVRLEAFIRYVRLRVLLRASGRHDLRQRLAVS